jgi:ketosteroid isomerase-like protein
MTGFAKLTTIVAICATSAALARLDAQSRANPSHTIGRVEGTAEREVKAAEAARFDAMIRGDLRALDTLLASELTYTHTGGERQSKAEFEQMLRSGELRYLGAEPESVAVRVYGNTALADGLSRMRVRSASGEASFTIRFLEAYVRRRGRWELVAWQSTRLPSKLETSM